MDKAKDSSSPAAPSAATGRPLPASPPRPRSPKRATSAGLLRSSIGPSSPPEVQRSLRPVEDRYKNELTSPAQHAPNYASQRSSQPMNPLASPSSTGSGYSFTAGSSIGRSPSDPGFGLAVASILAHHDSTPVVSPDGTPSLESIDTGSSYGMHTNRPSTLHHDYEATVENNKPTAVQALVDSLSTFDAMELAGAVDYWKSHPRHLSNKALEQALMRSPRSIQTFDLQVRLRYDGDTVALEERAEPPRNSAQCLGIHAAIERLRERIHVRTLLLSFAAVLSEFQPQFIFASVDGRAVDILHIWVSACSRSAFDSGHRSLVDFLNFEACAQAQTFYLNMFPADADNALTVQKVTIVSYPGLPKEVHRLDYEVPIPPKRRVPSERPLPASMELSEITLDCCPDPDAPIQTEEPPEDPKQWFESFNSRSRVKVIVKFFLDGEDLIMPTHVMDSAADSHDTDEDPFTRWYDPQAAMLTALNDAQAHHPEVSKRNIFLYRLYVATIKQGTQSTAEIVGSIDDDWSLLPYRHTIGDVVLKNNWEASDPLIMLVQCVRRSDRLLEQLASAQAAGILSDLHTHLLGMGSADFWVYRIMCAYLPRATRYPKARELQSWASFTSCLKTLAGAPDLSEYTSFGKINERYQHSGWLDQKSKLYEELQSKEDHEMQEYLATNFTDDVVYSVERLLSACGIDDVAEGKFKDHSETEKADLLHRLASKLYNAHCEAGFYRYFKEYVVWNARSRRLEMVLGLPNSLFVELLQLNAPAPSSSALLLSGIVRNWFEFLGGDGSRPKASDVLSLYRGRFTPAFAPRRFCIKDSIYEQRPEVLAILLNTVLHRYCKAGVRLVELSASSKDLTHEKLLDIMIYDTFEKPLLPSIGGRPADATVSEAEVHDDSNKPPAWARIVPDSYNSRPDKLDVRFLMALPRCNIQWPDPECIHGKLVLNFEKDATKNPRKAFEKLMLTAKILTTMRLRDGDAFAVYAKMVCEEDNIFRMFPWLSDPSCPVNVATEALTRPPDAAPLNLHWSNFRNVVVGVDWVADELGFPFCGLLHTKVLDLVKCMRQYNPYFGVRFHAGEGVPRSDGSDELGIVGLAFELHTRILMEATMCLQKKLEAVETPIAALSSGARLPGLRIGHGVAFLFEGGPGIRRGSTLKNDILRFQHFLREKYIIVEVNPTSNEMLVADTYASRNLRNERTISRYLALSVPITICTDNDGIWALHRCPQHKSHTSVAFEICQAIVHGEITSMDELFRIIQAGLLSRFFRGELG